MDKGDQLSRYDENGYTITDLPAGIYLTTKACFNCGKDHWYGLPIGTSKYDWARNRSGKDYGQCERCGCWISNGQSASTTITDYVGVAS